MNDFAKIKNRKPKGRLGKPPAIEETPENLSQPEIAPVAHEKTDGRSKRATGRTEQFATRITPNLKKWLKVEAATVGVSQAELLERMRVTYEEKNDSS